MEMVVEKWGDGLGVKIPRSFVQEMALRDGDKVKITGLGQGMLISPGWTESLQEMLDRVTPENIHGEIDFGPPVGKEVW